MAAGKPETNQREEKTNTGAEIPNAAASTAPNPPAYNPQSIIAAADVKSDMPPLPAPVIKYNTLAVRQVMATLFAEQSKMAEAKAPAELEQARKLWEVNQDKDAKDVKSLDVKNVADIKRRVDETVTLAKKHFSTAGVPALQPKDEAKAPKGEAKAEEKSGAGSPPPQTQNVMTPPKAGVQAPKGEEKKGNEGRDTKYKDEANRPSILYPYLPRFNTDAAFAANMKGHAESTSQDLPETMKAFCKYLVAVSRKPVEAQAVCLEAFPPESKDEMLCLGGTGSRIDALTLKLTANDAQKKLLEAHDVAIAQSVDKLKYVLEATREGVGAEVHLPFYLRYALGLETREALLKKDGMLMSPERYIPVDIMWDILSNYHVRVQVRLNKGKEEEIPAKLKAVKSLMHGVAINEIMTGNNKLLEEQHELGKKILKCSNTIKNLEKQQKDKPLNDAEQAEKTKAEKDKAELEVNLQTVQNSIKEKNKEIQGKKEYLNSQIKTILPPVKDKTYGINDLVDWDENYINCSWKSEKETRAVIEEYIDAQYAAMFPVPASAQPAAVPFAEIWGNKSVPTITKWLKYDDPDDAIRAVDALWVLGGNFMGNNKPSFLERLEYIGDNIFPREFEEGESLQVSIEKARASTENLLLDISKKLPKGHPLEEMYKHKVDMVRSYYSAALSGKPRDPVNLGEAISRFRPLCNIDLGMIKQASSLKEEDADYLLWHPERLEILKAFKAAGQKPPPPFLFRFIGRTIHRREADIATYAIENFLGEYISHVYARMLLLHSIKCDMPEQAILLLKKGASHSAVDTDTGKTPLMYAAEFGQVGVVEEIMKRGKAHECIAPDKSDKSAMQYAVANGRVKVVELFFNQPGLSPLYKNSYYSICFVTAAASGQVGMLEYINSQGEITVASKNTALFHAAQKGHVRAVQFLLGIGANINAVDDVSRSTPLMAAAASGHVGVVRELLKPRDGVKIDVYKEYGIESEPGQRDTALTIASVFNNLEVVEELLSVEGSDLSENGQNAVRALHLSVLKGYAKITEAILSHKSVKIGKDVITEHYLSTNYAETVKCLLEHGADVNAIQPNGKFKGRTKLMEAAHNQDLPLVNVLLDAGADVYYTNESRSAILEAAKAAVEEPEKKRLYENVIDAILKRMEPEKMVKHFEVLATNNYDCEEELKLLSGAVRSRINEFFKEQPAGIGCHAARVLLERLDKIDILITATYSGRDHDSDNDICA